MLYKNMYELCVLVEYIIMLISYWIQYLWLMFYEK